jgi:N,N'-diacetyllegionaminate synthase
MKIGSFDVGAPETVFVIAEAGVNHNGDVALARRLIDAAADAGADAVKFQTFSARRLASPDAPKAEYQLARTDAAESQYEMLRRLELSEAAHRELLEYAGSRGILFLSSPFDEACADLLESVGVEAYKVPSGEIINLPYLRHLGRKGKPIILSTGMSTLAEVETAVGAIRETGNDSIVILHCVSSYPAPERQINLRAMDTMRRAFGLPVGFSDHTAGTVIPIAAVARGACMVEKHLTLDRSMEGPDHAASLEPAEFTAMVQSLRMTALALGDGVKRLQPSEIDCRDVARKSVAVARDLPAGTRLSEDHLVVTRPGTGIRPGDIRFLLGRRTNRPLRAGELLTLESLE